MIIMCEIYALCTPGSASGFCFAGLAEVNPAAASLWSRMVKQGDCCSPNVCYSEVYEHE